MDLRVEAERLRLDVLTVAVSARLGSAGVPHAILKGPSTANWLYDPPRRYRDVDVLVPISRIAEVVALLSSDGLATATAGGVGEEAEHSLLMLSRDGFEVDVHLSLPAVPILGDRVWHVLADHVVELDLGVGRVIALDEPARCLVLALHALNNMRPGAPALEDLRRAVTSAAPESWLTARILAERLEIFDLFDAGRSLVTDVPAGGTAAVSPRARLHLSGAQGAALGLQRLSELPWRRRPAAVLREFAPSRGFMGRADPDLAAGRVSLPRAHLRRWGRLAAGTPRAIRDFTRARRGRDSGGKAGYPYRDLTPGGR